MHLRKSLAVMATGVMLMGYACTSVETQKTLAISGDAILQAGNRFVDVANSYNVQCKPIVKPDMTKFCAGFKAFAPKFQEQYPRAVASWKAGVNANDAAAANGAQQAVLGLMTDLAVIVSSAIEGSR